MQSGCKQIIDEKTYTILQDLLSNCGEQINKEEFKQEIENSNEKKDLTSISYHFLKSIKHIASQDIKDYMGPMLAKVKKNNKNGTINVVPLHQKSDTEIWTEVYNPTIFQYLEEGDTVILGFAKTSQKSNCWVEMVIIDNAEDFRKKTIFRHIDELEKIKENIQFLEKWLSIISQTL